MEYSGEWDDSGVMKISSAARALLEAKPLLGTQQIINDMSSKLKLYAYYTEEISQLKDQFLNSIKDDWDINIEKWDSFDGNSDFGSEQFRLITTKKLYFLHEKIKENMGSIIIYSDVDIQFFRPCNSILLDLLDGNDLLFQSEMLHNNKAINSGFIVIKCNENTLRMFNACSNMIINEQDTSIYDQDKLQYYIIKNTYLKWSVLPIEFYNMSFGLPIPSNIILHHATCTEPKTINGKEMSSFEQKIVQLEDIKNRVLNAKA